MKTIFTFLFLQLQVFSLLSQIAIGDVPSVLSPNTIFEMSSINKGFAIPRLSNALRETIPATIGLTVYENDTKAIWYNNGTNWVRLRPSKWSNIPINPIHIVNNTSGNVGIGTNGITPLAPLHIYKFEQAYIIWQNSITGTGAGNGFYLGNEFGANSNYIWNYENARLKIGVNNNTVFEIENGNNPRVAFGQDSPVPSAILSASSTEKGFLLPRMTTDQMYEIASPQNGLMIYNLSNRLVYIYSGSEWKHVTTF
jgi:hypothetical protein